MIGQFFLLAYGLWVLFATIILNIEIQYDVKPQERVYKTITRRIERDFRRLTLIGKIVYVILMIPPSIVSFILITVFSYLCRVVRWACVKKDK